jgi:hypothetical protein
MYRIPLPSTRRWIWLKNSAETIPENLSTGFLAGCKKQRLQSKDYIRFNTSNYTHIPCNHRSQGENCKGPENNTDSQAGRKRASQSHALFQHMENLPEMITGLLEEIDKERIGAVAASNRPRPVEGSYMPVF